MSDDALQKWLPRQLQYTNAFETEVDADSENQLGPLAAVEAIAAHLFHHFPEHTLFGHTGEIIPIVIEHFPIEDRSPIPPGLDNSLSQILTRWSQTLANARQPSILEAAEVSTELLIFALAELHPTWVEAVEEEPLFEIVYTIHMVGSTQITATTPLQLDDQIEDVYETLDLVNCDIDSHDERVLPLNEKAREVLLQWGRLNSEEEEIVPSCEEDREQKLISHSQEQELTTEFDETALLAELRERLQLDSAKQLFGEQGTNALLYLLDMAESAMHFPRGRQS